MMQSQSPSGAEIVPFRARARFRLGLHRTESAVLVHLRLARSYTPVCVDGWYHEEAVRADAQTRDA